MKPKAIIATVFLTIVAVCGMIIWVSSIKERVINGLNAPFMSKEVQGIIVASDFDYIARIGINKYDIEYIFTVNGVDYQGVDSIGTRALDLVPNSLAGQAVTVKYKPQNPAVNQVANSLFSFAIITSAIIMTASLAGVLAFGFLSSRRPGLFAVARIFAIIWLLVAIVFIVLVINSA